MILKLFFLLSFFALALSAHKTGLSYVDLKVREDKKIDVIYKKPFQDIKAKDIVLRYPVECKQITSDNYSVENGYAVDRYTLYCGIKALWKKRIWVDGLVSSDRGVMIHYENEKKSQNALLRSTTPFVYINYKSDTLTLFLEYIKLGIVHILSGFDHLLFVFGVLLLAKNKKILLFAITAFTVSHSITLACGILGLVNIPSLYIEAMIALSIVFLARELVVDTSQSLTRKNLWLITFVFGLLHGFGFSNVLSTIGLPQDAIPISLFAFNVGIELGQLFFVGIMSGILFLLYKKRGFKKKNIEKYIAYFIGALASFWLIERVMLF